MVVLHDRHGDGRDKNLLAGHHIGIGLDERRTKGRLGYLIVIAVSRLVVAGKGLKDDGADRIGPVWGFDEGGELRNMWQPTAQPGLWFTAGSLAQCRIYSRYLALQIKAREEGLIAA